MRRTGRTKDGSTSQKEHPASPSWRLAYGLVYTPTEPPVPAGKSPIGLLDQQIEIDPAVDGALLFPVVGFPLEGVGRLVVGPLDAV
jgi:hypothetical protein